MSFSFSHSSSKIDQQYINAFSEKINLIVTKYEIVGLALHCMFEAWQCVCIRMDGNVLGMRTKWKIINSFLLLFFFVLERNWISRWLLWFHALYDHVNVRKNWNRCAFNNNTLWSVSHIERLGICAQRMWV